MQRSNIEWTEFVSNPIKGKCHHHCSYCYAERIRQRFKWPREISWHPKELFEIEKRKKPSTIFIGSMYDIFGEWVSRDWILWILDTVRKCPQHTFLFLTKNPKRYHEFEFSENCWLGETITDNSFITGIMPPGNKKFISFEPLLSAIPLDIMEGYNGIIIGGMTGPNSIVSRSEWIMPLWEYAIKKNITVFLKFNLHLILANSRSLPWKAKKK